MSDQSLGALAKALLADPPRPVDPEALASADRDELASALRRAVTDLPPTEQRIRLAAAFRAISADAPSAVAAAAGTPPAVAVAMSGVAETSPMNEHPATAIHRSLLSMPSFTPARLGLLAGVLVVSLLAGVLAGVVTGSDDPDEGGVLAAAQDPVPVLSPIGTGDNPPPADFVAGLLPPDPEEQADAMRDAIEERADELGDDVDGIDPDDLTVPVGDDVAPISGYADGSSIFGEAESGNDGVDPGENPGGGDGTGESDQGGGDSSTSGDGPDGVDSSGAPGPDGSDGDSPALVDICARDEPPEDCDGVGGTVSLATVEAFRFNYEPAALTYWPACVGRRDLSPDEFIIELQTNNLGDFTARYRIAGTDSPYEEIAGESPPIWREALDDGSVAQVVTCLIAERPAETRALRLEVDITGVGRHDSGTVRFAGVVDLAEAPAPEAEPERRAGRPPVQVEAVNASTLHVTVPLGPDETASVGLVPRGRDGTGAGCEAASVATGSSITPVVARRPGEITLMADWTDEIFELSAPEAGPYLVCVDWLDDFDPPRNLERASIPVEIAAVSRAELLIAGYEPARGASIQPDRVEVSGQLDGICGSEILTGDGLRGTADRRGADVLCSFDTSPSHVGVVSTPAFSFGPPLIQRALIAVPESCASAGTSGYDGIASSTCTIWYMLNVRDPGRAVAGAVVVGIRLTGGRGPQSVTIGDERPEFTDENEIDGPRLRWDHVSAEPHPANPSRRAIVRWATDVPAQVQVEATPQSRTPSCDTKRAPVSAVGTEGSVAIGGLCPGVRYYVSFDLTSEDGRRTVYDSWNPRSGVGSEVGIVRRSAVLTMEAMTAELDFTLEFAEIYDGAVDRPDSSRGVVPSSITLAFGDYRYDYSQYYDGHAYFTLDCAVPPHFNQSGSGIPIEIRGGTVRPSDARFEFHHYGSYFNNFAGCPATGQQFRGDRGSSNCAMVVSGMEAVGDSNHIDNLLAGGEAVFTGESPRCGGFFEVTLTVRVRDTRVLRGG